MMIAADVRPHLRRWVASIIGYDETTAPDAVHFGAPSPAATVILSLAEPVDAAWSAGGPAELRPGLIAGLHTRPSIIRTHGGQTGLQLSLTPAGVRAILGMPIAEIAAVMVEVDRLSPRLEACRRRLEATSDWGLRLSLLQDELERAAGAVGPHTDPDPFAQRCWDLLLASGGRASVASVAAATGASRRTVTAHVSRELGIGPKEAARVIRFDRSRRLWDASRARHEGAGGAPSLASLAAACGYSDHAHLTREWRALGGQTPSGYEVFPKRQADEPA